MRLILLRLGLYSLKKINSGGERFSEYSVCYANI